MKQIIQSYKTGELGVFDVPAPLCEPQGILIKTTASLVSAGTEKMIIDIAKKSLVGKARARPDLVKQVVDKMKKEGIKNTLEKVFTKLDTPIPLGYSCAGEVLQVGAQVTGVSVGDRVACGGATYANHSEVNYIPRNLFVKIPEGVHDIDASFVTVGAIALQGVRQTEPTLGERIAVIGLGLLGQLTVQLLKANGCKVLGADLDPDKLAKAKELGADMVCSVADLQTAAADFSDGYGVDKVVIAASTSSNQPVTDAGEIARMKAKVVIVGMVGMDIPRNIYYKKELDLRLSMAYGPGRYDPEYEEKGIDYPFAHVRWTEQRNFQAFLELVAEGKVTPSKLITHEYDFDQAIDAYNLLEGKTKEKYLGIVLKYNNEIALAEHKKVTLPGKNKGGGKIRVGLVGAGNFTKSVILPQLTKNSAYELKGLCTATGVSGHGTGKKYDFGFITTDSQELMTHQEVDAVFITTRHNSHGAQVLEALQNQKHVFVEKPLCIFPDELEAITRQEADSDGLVQVGFNRRFAPLIRKMQNEVKGQPITVNYRINAGVIPKDVWIQDAEVGGGRIIGEVCHFIDTCSYLTGSDPVSVSAQCVRKNDQSIPDEDNVSITLTYENGSIATISYTAYGNRQLPKEYIELFAPDIAMQMTDFRELLIFKGSKKQKVTSANQDKGFAAEFKSFAESIEKGEPAIPFKSIKLTTQATFAILQSLKTGEPQPLV